MGFFGALTEGRELAGSHAAGVMSVIDKVVRISDEVGHHLECGTALD